MYHLTALDFKTCPIFVPTTEAREHRHTGIRVCTHKQRIKESLPLRVITMNCSIKLGLSGIPLIWRFEWYVRSRMMDHGESTHLQIQQKRKNTETKIRYIIWMVKLSDSQLNDLEAFHKLWKFAVLELFMTRKELNLQVF